MKAYIPVVVLMEKDGNNSEVVDVVEDNGCADVSCPAYTEVTVDEICVVELSSKVDVEKSIWKRNNRFRVVDKVYR